MLFLLLKTKIQNLGISNNLTSKFVIRVEVPIKPRTKIDNPFVSILLQTSIDVLCAYFARLHRKVLTVKNTVNMPESVAGPAVLPLFGK